MAPDGARPGEPAAIKVSVLVMSFNQSGFLAQALDSVLGQRTDFGYEIVVADDASTDDTRSIIEKYRARSDRLRLLARERNLGMVGNFVDAYAHCRGKYIAFLDGDDYWTSPDKLQKQADLLDRRPDLALCFHRARFVSEAPPAFDFPHPADGAPVVATCEDLLRGDCTPTNATMVRRLFDRLPDWCAQLPLADWPVFVLHAMHGGIGYLPDVMSVYRFHPASSWSSLARSAKLPRKILVRRGVARALGPPVSDVLAPVVARLEDELRSHEEAGGAKLLLPGERCGAVVIAGMHRSGTSLLASLLQDAGVYVGERLQGVALGNPRGHFEDNDFVDLHRRALIACGLDEDGFLDAALPEVTGDVLHAAEALVRERRFTGRLWGWKDPRTVLFLDFWDRLLPDAGYVFVFRSPWEVADSLFRRGDPTFQADPELAIRVWLHYNRRILSFVQRNPARCLLREVTQVAKDPEELFPAMREAFGVPLGEVPCRYERELLVEDAGSARAALLRAHSPAAHELYRELQRLAGAGTARPAAETDDAGTVTGTAIRDWARARRLESLLDESSRQMDSLTLALAREKERREGPAVRLRRHTRLALDRLTKTARRLLPRT